MRIKPLSQLRSRMPNHNLFVQDTVDQLLLCWAKVRVHGSDRGVACTNCMVKRTMLSLVTSVDIIMVSPLLIILLSIFQLKNGLLLEKMICPWFVSLAFTSIPANRSPIFPFKNISGISCCKRQRIIYGLVSFLHGVNVFVPFEDIFRTCVRFFFCREKPFKVTRVCWRVRTASDP